MNLSPELEKELSKKTVIATIVGSSDTIRNQFFRRFAAEAKQRGFDMAAVFQKRYDPDIRKHYELHGFHTYEEEVAGYGKASRLAFKHARDLGEIVAFATSEKFNYVPQIPNTVLPVYVDRADIVIPRRRSLSSYPAKQQLTEREGNEFYEQLTRLPFDAVWGTHTSNKKAVQVFLDYENANFPSKIDKWDSIIVPIIDMPKAGIRMESVEVDYECPKEQRLAEDINPDSVAKRYEQLSMTTRAMLERHKQLYPELHSRKR